MLEKCPTKIQRNRIAVCNAGGDRARTGSRRRTHETDPSSNRVGGDPLADRGNAAAQPTLPRCTQHQAVPLLLRHDRTRVLSETRPARAGVARAAAGTDRQLADAYGEIAQILQCTRSRCARPRTARGRLSSRELRWPHLLGYLCRRPPARRSGGGVRARPSSQSRASRGHRLCSRRQTAPRSLGAGARAVRGDRRGVSRVRQ